MLSKIEVTIDFNEPVGQTLSLNTQNQYGEPLSKLFLITVYHLHCKCFIQSNEYCKLKVIQTMFVYFLYYNNYNIFQCLRENLTINTVLCATEEEFKEHDQKTATKMKKCIIFDNINSNSK